MREDMATVDNNVETEDSPSGFKSPVWRHFGFPIYTNTTGEKRTDKTKTACKYCKRLLTYTGNTSNMQQYINRHHSEKQSNVTPPPERKGDERCLVPFRHDSWLLVSSDHRVLFLTVWVSFRSFFVNSKWAFLCLMATQISGVLQWWLSFWKFLPCRQRISGAQPAWTSGLW